jgi:hypothetical protein
MELNNIIEFKSSAALREKLEEYGFTKTFD